MKRINEANVNASLCSRLSDPGSRRIRKRPSASSKNKQIVSSPPPKGKVSNKSTTGSGSGGTMPSGSRGDEHQPQPQKQKQPASSATTSTGRYHRVQRKAAGGGGGTKNASRKAKSGGSEKAAVPKKHIFLDVGSTKMSDFKLSVGDTVTPDPKMQSLERKTRSSTVESSGVATELSPKPVHSGESASSKEADQQHLLYKRAWDIALGPVKQIPMNIFIMFMAGNSISIFPIMMVGMMFIRPIQALLKVGSTFKPLQGSIGNNLYFQKFVFMLGNLMGLALALYKCSSMGLLPTHQSDWLAFIEEPIRAEYSGGGANYF